MNALFLNHASTMAHAWMLSTDTCASVLQAGRVFSVKLTLMNACQDPVRTEATALTWSMDLAVPVTLAMQVNCL